MDSVNSFEPVINKQSKIIILGTMPGVQSLEKQQYYANARNQFWKIIYALYDSVPVVVSRFILTLIPAIFFPKNPLFLPKIPQYLWV